MNEVKKDMKRKGKEKQTAQKPTSWDTHGIERIVGLEEPPCTKLEYCPYGPMVEASPLREDRGEQSCPIFGHECPAFTASERIDDGWIAEIKKKWPSKKPVTGS